MSKDSRKGKTTVRIDDDLHHRAKLAATYLHMPVQRFVEEAVRARLEAGEALRPKAVGPKSKPR